jgi:hypothetical protein
MLGGLTGVGQGLTPVAEYRLAKRHWGTVHKLNSGAGAIGLWRPVVFNLLLRQNLTDEADW